HRLCAQAKAALCYGQRLSAARAAPAVPRGEAMGARTSPPTGQLALPFEPTTPPSENGTSGATPAEGEPRTSADGPALVVGDARLLLDVRVNRRLQRTYRWRIQGDRLIVERPARVDERDVQLTLETIRERAAAYLQRTTADTDAVLLERARRLLRRYFPERPV